MTDGMIPALSVLIFSKDRALQLHSLLESIRDHLQCTKISLTVLYRASSDEFSLGYNKLKSAKIIHEIIWVEESNFHNDCVRILSSIPPKMPLMMLVDDDILFRKIDMDPLLSSFTKRHLFISLRADRSYPEERQPLFNSSNTYLSWRWKSLGKTTVWQYPFSVDGNVFHAEDIQNLAKKIRFKAPNTFEGMMHENRNSLRFRFLRPLGLAPLQSVLFNNPLNKVQTEGETWNSGEDPAELNRHYLDGMCIDNVVMYNSVPNNMHYSVPLKLKKSPFGEHAE